MISSVTESPNGYLLVRDGITLLLTLTDMAKTVAERQRIRRARLRQDKERYAKYLAEDRARKKVNRATMDEEELRNVRSRGRKATERWREKKSLIDGISKAKSKSGYKSPCSLGRAKRRVERSLPKSPSKRQAVLEKIIGQEKIELCNKPKRTRSISEETVKKVNEFYSRDDISRMMPGKADVVSLRSATGEKLKVQKRHLTMKVSEAYQLFKNIHPQSNIKKSKFADLRPREVFLAGDTPCNVCVCMYHANVCLILESLHRECPVIPLYSREGFLRKSVCNMEDLDCVSISCKQCKDGKLFDTVFSQYKSDKHIQWAAWGKSENGFLTKDTVEGTVQEALNVLKNQLSKFIWHAFIKEKQATSYQIDKEESTAPESEMCLLQMDFAQNYSCLFQDEIQSAHWRQRQITLYTIMAYHRQSKLAVVMVSDVLEHDKRAVAAFTFEALNLIKEQMSTVKEVAVWTDGPSSQYKNKYIFNLLPKLSSKFDMRVSWNYFSTSHGKGPNDALGGNVKAIIHRLVVTRKACVTSAATFSAALEATSSNIRVIHISDEGISRRCADLGVSDDFWERCISFPGTINTLCNSWK